jgi:hypothetical protein
MGYFHKEAVAATKLLFGVECMLGIEVENMINTLEVCYTFLSEILSKCTIHISCSVCDNSYNEFKVKSVPIEQLLKILFQVQHQPLCH